MSMYNQGSPYQIKLAPGETAYICQCGYTQRPPFCDGSHNEHPPSQPMAYDAEADTTLYVCGCGKSGNKPFCDGSHQS